MNIKRYLRALTFCATSLMAALPSAAQNPFLPLWEHIPDGEPYVFEDPDHPGKYRMYVYGSHDSLKKEYCGLEQVVWSAPVEDLTSWRYDGIIFKSVYDADGKLLNEGGKGDLLYAPDIALVEKDGKKTYYLYPNNQAGGRQQMIAKSDRPDGPFVVCNWSKDNPRTVDGVLQFDPGVFVDDDGRVYGYWGFERSYAAELDPNTMATVKPGTKIVEDLISHRKQDGDFRFFEASSIRKIEDKYIFIYSRWTKPGEFGLGDTNYTLAYAYSDNPLGPFTYGGTIIDGRARGLDEKGNIIAQATPGGNTHGSIVKVGKQWWVVYHRQSGLNEYNRQAMAAPITIKVQKGKGGKVTISEGEYTSEGFKIEGLNPFDLTPAGIACHYTGPKGARAEFPNAFYTGSYIDVTYFDPESYMAPYSNKIPAAPVVNNTSGSIVGYKYFNFNHLKSAKDIKLLVNHKALGLRGKMKILVGSPYESKGGKVIGIMTMDGSTCVKTSEVSITKIPLMKGKQPLYFVFESDTKNKSLCELYDFRFVK